MYDAAVPELPEVELVRRMLEPALAGVRIDAVEVRRADLRIPFPAGFGDRLAGQRVVAVTRRAKYLLAPLSSGETLLVHLGMSGDFRVERAAASEPVKHDHVVFTLASGQTVTFNDPRRFGLMDLVVRDGLPAHPALRELGPEPLSAEFDAAALARACHRKKAAIKVALLDQRVVAGVGNIYADESLFEAGLHPGRLGHTLETRERDRLRRAVPKVLTRAIEKRGSTIRDYVGGSGLQGGFQDEFKVYGRTGEPCRRCEVPIERHVFAGRSSHVCPRCQPQAAILKK